MFTIRKIMLLLFAQPLDSNNYLLKLSTNHITMSVQIQFSTLIHHFKWLVMSLGILTTCVPHTYIYMFYLEQVCLTHAGQFHVTSKIVSRFHPGGGGVACDHWGIHNPGKLATPLTTHGFNSFVVLRWGSHL